MPKYIVERDLSGKAGFTPIELKGLALKSNKVAAGMNGRVHWIESYVTGDKIYCVYIADSDEAIWEHAKLGEFPCTAIRKVETVIDKTTGE